MNRFKFLFLSALTFGTAAHTFASDVQSEFKAFMNAMGPKVARAFETKDFAFFDKISTADFKVKEGKTVMNKAQAMAQIKQMFSTSENIKVQFKLISCKATGKVGSAITNGNYTFDMKMPDGKTHKMAMRQKMAESYRKTAEGWKISMIDNLPGGKMTMDGKPFNPAAMGGPPPPAKAKAKVG